MEVFEVKGKTFTRFKISKKAWEKGFTKRKFQGMTPSKESSRYIYFVLEGDFINTNKIWKMKGDNLWSNRLNYHAQTKE